MHVTKLQEKKEKFKQGLGGLQEGLPNNPPPTGRSYSGNGRFS